MYILLIEETVLRILKAEAERLGCLSAKVFLREVDLEGVIVLESPFSPVPKLFCLLLIKEKALLYFFSICFNF